MAEIISLAERRGRHGATARKDLPRNAEILFFTGVRYERLDDRPTEKGAMAGKSRRRGTSTKR